MSRAEMDELTVRVAQMVSMHDQRLRELEAVVMRKVIIPATGKYGKSFIEVDTKWKKGRCENCKGAMGSKHLRLAIALLEQVYNDPQLGMDDKTALDEIFTGMDLRTGAMGDIFLMMKWRAFNGGKDGPLEFYFAPRARDSETIMVKLLTNNGGKLSQGTAPRGPVIRKIDEKIANTWRHTMREDRENV